MALVGAAGPISNIILALIFTTLLKIFSLFLPMIDTSGIGWLITASTYFILLLYLGIYYNIAFAIFNLIPAPPLDGSRILYTFLPSKWLFKIQLYEKYFFLGVLIIMLIFSIIGISLIGEATKFIIDLLFKLFFI